MIVDTFDTLDAYGLVAALAGAQTFRGIAAEQRNADLDAAACAAFFGDGAMGEPGWTFVLTCGAPDLPRTTGAWYLGRRVISTHVGASC